MQKHDWAYSASEFRRMYVCDNEMLHNITRESILIFYYTNYVSIARYN